MCEISVIIVNWNGKHLLGDCLDSVLAQDFPDFEVILVDNGSSDGSVSFVQSNYPAVKLVPLPENRGFTGGNLAGFGVAQGAFIALLNNDTRTERGWLRALYAGMAVDGAIGLCASKLVIDGTDSLDCVGDRFTTAFTGTKLGSRHPRGEFSAPMYVHGACAAAALYRREMLDEIGFLDDDFYFNHEDTDLNLRAWFAGWKCLFCPDAIVHHKVSASIGELSAATVYYFSRNNEWVWIKNVPFLLMIRYLPQRVLYEITSLVFYGFKARRFLPFVKGKIDAFRMFPAMFKKRRAIQLIIRIPHKEISSGLIPMTSYLRERFVRFGQSGEIVTKR